MPRRGEFGFTEILIERFLNNADINYDTTVGGVPFERSVGRLFDLAGLSDPAVKGLGRRKEKKIVSIRMPFGKHKGTPIVNLPTDYLDWLLDWMDSEESGWMSNSRKRLFDELDEEYQRRKTGQRPTKVMKTKFAIGDDARKMLPEFIKSGYRAMALKIHPDKGGTAEQMVALRELKEALEKL